MRIKEQSCSELHKTFVSHCLHSGIVVFSCNHLSSHTSRLDTSDSLKELGLARSFLITCLQITERDLCRINHDCPCVRRRSPPVNSTPSPLGYILYEPQEINFISISKMPQPHQVLRSQLQKQNDQIEFYSTCPICSCRKMTCIQAADSTRPVQLMSGQPVW